MTDDEKAAFAVRMKKAREAKKAPVNMDGDPIVPQDDDHMYGDSEGKITAPRTLWTMDLLTDSLM